MRRAAIVLAVCCLAGCGGGESEQGSQLGPPVAKGDFGPTMPGHGKRARPAAPPRKQASAPVAAQLDGGTVGVVGVDGAIGVRPASLAVAADGTIEDLKWSRWGSRKALGDGRMRILDCDPTCAGGGVDHVQVEIELSAPRLCGRATYFDRAVLTGGGDDPPASYVRAPC